jgi:hypothetical protein
MEETIFDRPPWVVTVNSILLFVEALALFAVLGFFWEEYMLTDFATLKGAGDVSAAGLAKVWPIFAWAATISVALQLFASDFPYIREPMAATLKGWWISINAGVFEELIYRWLVFCSAMVLLPFFDFITFDIVGWIYTEALVPLANFATFHMLEPQLLSSNWIFGAAIVSASSDFRNQHAYQGVLGEINSWYMGMVFFYLTFNYGLFTAIAAHILYDAICFTIIAWSGGIQTKRLLSRRARATGYRK